MEIIIRKINKKMRKILVFATAFVSVLAFNSCSKEISGLVEQEQTTEESDNDNTTGNGVSENVKSIFGVEFSKDQTWSSIISGTISVKADADLNNIVKVQILTESPFGNDNARVLNEAPVTKGQTVDLVYDAPSNYTRLFAACVNNEGIYYVKGFAIGEKSISFAAPANSRASKAPFRLPQNAAEIKLATSCRSFNNLRTEHYAENSSMSMFKDSGWEHEMLWQVSDADEAKLKENISDMDENLKADIKAIFNGYLTRKDEKGNKQWNLQRIYDSQIFSMENNYLTSTGDEPIILTPVMMASTEIKDCDIYYYYYNPEVTMGMNRDQEIQFMKDLPKYRAFRVKNVGQNISENVFKSCSFALLYFGDDAPAEGKAAVSYNFPVGYKIGFMFRKTKNGANNYAGEQNGCGYADGRLNKQINMFGHFKNAKLGESDPRFALFGANGNTYMAVEDGVDQQFSDLILEVSGGAKKIDEPENIMVNVYSYCFEDREIADYDMNDVVIKAKRLDINHVVYSLEACGGWDELYLRNIHGKVLNENTEIHALFGLSDLKIFANTQGNHRVKPVVDTISVDAKFSLATFENQLYIYNKTMGHEVKLAKAGEDPHGIIIPSDFQYPKERICIKDAYLEFNNWGMNPVTSTDWYLHPVISNVYTESVFK